ncbi:hypothetical protein LNP25_18570 [Klebsiella variicola subsp. variicola]|nr:hypothetical protein [Klebsiella variicola subsp. variicola]
MDCLFLALVVFLAGVFVINRQLWHSDQATHVATPPVRRRKDRSHSG